MKTLCLRALVPLSVLIALLTGCASPADRHANDPQVQRLVSEDQQVRIDELRVRGQTQRLTVSPKGGSGRDYEILQPAPGQDLSQRRDAAGQRVWPVLTF